MVRDIRQPVLIIATSNNEVWAIRPSALATDLLWPKVVLGPPLVASKEKGVKPKGANCAIGPNEAWQEWTTLGQGRPNGLVGIEATPVVDLANNQVLVGFKTADGHQRLAAIDLNDGRWKSVEVPAPHAAANPDWHKLHRNRASLLLADGVVYLAFSSLCEGEHQKMHGSIVAFDARTLRHVSDGEFQVTDDKTDGGGIWQGATGLAADTRGNLYFITGNRRLRAPCLVGFDDRNDPDAANLANSVIRLKSDKRGAGGMPPRPGEKYKVKMTVEDYFTPYRKMLGDCWDLDLGSSGALLIPGSRFVVAGGKEGIIYVLDRADMGGFDNAGVRWSFDFVKPLFNTDTHRHNEVPDDPKRDRVQQKFQAGVNQYDADYLLKDLARWPHIHGTPVFARFVGGQSFMFVWPEKDWIKRYRWRGDRFDPAPRLGSALAPPFVKDNLNGMPGGMLSVNVDPNGPSLGVVFASVKICNDSVHHHNDRVHHHLEPGFPDCATDQNRGILRAYDPFTMHEVWSNRDESYWFSKFVPPTVANGRVFLPTASGKVLIYGNRR